MKGVIPGPNFTVMEIICLSRFFYTVRDQKAGYSKCSSKSTFVLDGIHWLDPTTEDLRHSELKAHSAIQVTIPKTMLSL